MTFHHPSIWFLIMLLLLPLLWRRWRSPQRRAAVTFSSTDPIEQIGPTWAVRCRWIVPALRLLALALLIFAMARPQKGDEHTRVDTEGVAIQLIVDRSGSMRALDFQINGIEVDRLTAVKRVVEDFVVGSKSANLPGRPNDLIGMIGFASFADTLCPITSDHAHLIDSITQMRIASEQQESATAIGDAIALGVERLSTLNQRLKSESSSPIKSKLIILLTDGENNAGDIEPLTAAQMAAAYGIKIYAIGAGTDKGVAKMPAQDLFGNTIIQHVPVSIDEKSLTQIAETTGGEYFRATDTNSLQQIYAQIDALERTKVNERRFITFKEAAVETVTVRLFGRAWAMPPLIMIVLVLLGLEAVLSNTRFRTMP